MENKTIRIIANVSGGFVAISTLMTGDVLTFIWVCIALAWMNMYFEEVKD